MKKIPLHTSILFVLALIPAVVFGFLMIIAVIYGDIEEVIGSCFILVPVIICFIHGINLNILYIVAFLVVVFQIMAVVNFIRKKVREYNENNTNKE
ncbi:MAG: hypothetical protein NC177_01960 [Ruminococcus flavefaciens]|nr:hypothetical protein [Ruminococcus flavefaciens]